MAGVDVSTLPGRLVTVDEEQTIESEVVSGVGRNQVYGCEVTGWCGVVWCGVGGKCMAVG